MADHPNAVALRKGYEAFAQGDMDTVATVFADDIAWHQSGSSPVAGDLTGKDAVFAMLARLAELTAGTFANTAIHDVLANDEHVVVLIEQSWDKPHPYRGNAVHVWHMTDGIATEAWLMFQDATAADAALTP